MFTGIIEEIGQVLSIEKRQKSARITISCHTVLQDSKLGDSIALNGVCLTATNLTKSSFTADVMAETMRRSSLGGLKTGSFVNLERAMAANGRFGGHMVSGHIDGVGTISALRQEENATWVTVTTQPHILKYIVEKGSIAIDGVSLTVAYVDEAMFQISMIPHTAKETTLLKKGIGSVVNLECDVIGKYVEKLLLPQLQSQQKEKSQITKDFLQQHGYSL